MPHNFRILGAGNKYISKIGNDANDNTNPETPAASIAHGTVNFAYGSAPTVVGTGQYSFDTTATFAYPQLSLLADGTVVLQPTVSQGAGEFSGATPGNGGYSMHFTGFIFRLYGSLAFTAYGDRVLNRTLNRCQLLFTSRATPNLSFHSDQFSYAGENNAELNDCIVLRGQMSTASAAQPIDMARRTLFVDCGDLKVVSASYSSFGPSSTLRLGSRFGNQGQNIGPGIIQNCNIQGAIVGTNGAVYANLAAAQAAGVLDSTNFNSLDGFNNPAAQDFTLRFNSANLANGVGPGHLRYALTWFVRSSAQPGQVATTVNTWLENSADGSRVDFFSLSGFSWSASQSLYITENLNGNFVATYLTGVLQFANTAQELQSLPVITGLNFDTATPVLESQFDSNNPEVPNNNVPDSNGHASGQPGRNPNRLTIRARFSTRQSPRANVDTDWFPNDGTLLEMEINTKPLWNQATGRGNGHPLFDPATAQVIRATAMQVEYTARNNYFSL